MRTITCTNEEIRKMITMFEDGKSMNFIAANTGKAPSTVKRILTNCGVNTKEIDNRAWQKAKEHFYGNWNNAPYSVKLNAFEHEKSKLVEDAKFYKDKIMENCELKPILATKDNYGVKYMWDQIKAHKDEFVATERIDRHYRYVNIKHGYNIAVLIKDGEPYKIVIS